MRYAHICFGLERRDRAPPVRIAVGQSPHRDNSHARARIRQAGRIECANAHICFAFVVVGHSCSTVLRIPLDLRATKILKYFNINLANSKKAFNFAPKLKKHASKNNEHINHFRHSKLWL